MMSTQGRHNAHDRVLADVQLIRRRLQKVGQRIDQRQDGTDDHLTGAHDSLVEHCDELEERIRSWKDLEVGVTGPVADLAGAVDALESDLDALDPTKPEDYELAVDRQVRAWRTRIDRLRLQSSLAAMGARDDLDDLSQRLDRVRGDVLVELQNTLGDTKELVGNIRTGVEDVLGDVRRAVGKIAKDLAKDEGARQ